jgi:hypothetical protein
MAFVVEDGSGKTDATSYCSVSCADDYHAQTTGSAEWAAASEANKQKALNSATQYLDLQYGARWRGYRANGYGYDDVQEQALDWPRMLAYDQDGWPYDEDRLPTRLRQATCEAALRILKGDDLLATVTDPGTLAAESITVGPVTERKDYVGGKPYGYVYRKIDALVRPLINSGTEVIRG